MPAPKGSLAGAMALATGYGCLIAPTGLAPPCQRPFPAAFVRAIGLAAPAGAADEEKLRAPSA